MTNVVHSIKPGSGEVRAGAPADGCCRGSAAGRLHLPGVARRLIDLDDRVRVVGDGDVISVAGFEVTVAGKKHHVSHPDVPPVDNVGFLIDGEVFHPGDALTLLDVPTLLVPGQAPWMTAPDLI